MKKAVIQYDSHSLILNGKREILIGGEFHYFRTPSALWDDRLKKIKQAGCNLVTTYIPWNFHEEKQGKLTWDGDRDLPKFLELCKKYNLYVIIKPGPYICAEWDFGGFPHWLLEKDIPLRLPDKEYLEIVKKWYQEVAGIIKPFLFTNGGNIVLIQVENEYDHLIDFSDLVENKEVGKQYLLKLLQFVRDAGIDIPAFTNEGSCILGTEIINTHTYYPNIPWIWMWEFNDFDRKIEISRKVQTDKPLMILELEAGWFAQFGKPLYNVETELTDAITKTVLTYGASVLNYYMLAGGTSFPYWSAKGDYGGIGICTTFDFGASPIREWGEIHEKYHHLRNFAYLLKSFPEIITEGETTYDNVDFAKGGEDILRLFKNKAVTCHSFKDSYENIKILYRKHPKYGMILIRNLEAEEKKVKISYDSNLIKQTIQFPNEDLTLIPRSSFLLPVDFYIHDDIHILYSTSEILLKKKINGIQYIFLKGNEKIKGEMAIQSNSPIEILKGEIKHEKYLKNSHKLLYSHSDVNIFEINQIHFVILPEKEANKIWVDDDFILLSDFYHLKQWEKKDEETYLNFQIMNNKHVQKLILWSMKEIKKIEIEGEEIPLKKDQQGQTELNYTFQEESLNQAKWENDWRYYSDTEEKMIDFNDSHWKVIDKDTPLEKAKLFTHGYYWYRNEFVVPEDCDEVTLKLQTNEMDRLTVYINGKFKWIGIGSPDLDITEEIQPGRNIVAISYENAFHTKAHPHEGPIKKLSGLYYPVTVMYKSKNKHNQYVFKEWKVKQGLGGVNKEYYSEKFNDRGWIRTSQADKYIFEEEVGNIIWLRRNFTLKKEAKWDTPLYVNIKECFDRCLIYINGFLVGKYEEVGPQHKFYIPENLLKERNLLTFVIEGPGIHPVKGFGFVPPKLVEPELGFYYEAKDIEVKVKF